MIKEKISKIKIVNKGRKQKNRDKNNKCTINSMLE